MDIEKYIAERPDLEQMLMRDWPLVIKLVEKNHFSKLLEIGTFRGATTLRLAYMVSKWGGVIDTININDWELEIAKTVISENNLTNVRFHLGDSLEVLNNLDGPWDFVLIDGRHTYAHSMGDYLAIKPKLTENALVVFDDAGYLSGDMNCPHCGQMINDGGVPQTAKALNLQIYDGRVGFKMIGTVNLDGLF